jgi:uncharacterized protein (DUF58 family)
LNFKKPLVLIFALIITLLIAINTQVGWLFLFASIYFAILIISFFVPRVWLSGLKVDSPNRVTAVRLTDSLINLEFFNKHMYPVGPIFLALDIAGDRRRIGPLFLGSRKKTIVELIIKPARRGLHRSAELVLSTGGPFDIFSARKEAVLDTNMLVLPRYIKKDLFIDSAGIPETAGLDENRPTDSQRGPTVSGIKRYRPGAPLKDIHWRSFAKKQYPLMKEFEDESDLPAIRVTVDDNFDSYENEEHFDLAADVAASVCDYLSQNSLSYNLASTSQADQISYKPAFKQTLAWLANLNLSTSQKPASTGNRRSPGLQKNNSIFIGGEKSFKDMKDGRPIVIRCREKETLEQCLAKRLNFIKK